MRGPHYKLWTELFFSSFYGPSAKGADHANKEGKNDRGSITCRTDRANEANKMFITWLCWLIPGKERNYLTYWWVIKSWTSVYGYLRTWNWPITAREISQPYNKTIYFTGISYDGANTSLFNTFRHLFAGTLVCSLANQYTEIHALSVGMPFAQ